MKTLYLTLLLIVVAQLDSFAGDLFREVTVRQDSWEVVFRDQGVRYGIEIDGVEQGTSAYLQRLRLLPNESLRLIDKHSHRDIRPLTKDGKVGLEITERYQDRFTGEQKNKITFEPNHKTETR